MKTGGIRAAALAAALAALGGGEAPLAPPEPAVVQLLEPLPIAEAAKWECCIEAFPLSAGRIVDTANLALRYSPTRNTTRVTPFVIHSWQVVQIDGRPFVVVTYLYPRP
ncbi:MAG: hypothetical protein N3B15_07025 [Planctomycetota bacterium]|nr:hypothetical protein [Planctomycetota bacterium]